MPKSEPLKAKEYNYSARFLLLLALFLNFKVPSLEAAVSCQHFAVKNINICNEY